MCNTPAPGALAGAVALYHRSTCFFATTVPNAQAGGAVGVIIINNTSNAASLSNWGGLNGATIPAVMISQSDGQNLQAFVDANPATTVSINTQSTQVPGTLVGLVADAVAYFASRGPSIGNNGLKPDVSAAATNFLLAAENIDPFGDVFLRVALQCRSGWDQFCQPHAVAGAAALVKQAQPNLTPLQVKSVLVNSATLSGILNQAGTGSASIADVGSGLLQAQNAIAAPVAVQSRPPSPFGSVAAGLPVNAQTVTFHQQFRSAAHL